MVFVITSWSRPTIMAGHTASVEQMINACRVLVRKPKRETPFEITELIWENNITINLVRNIV
jgi:hypothetical protein